MKQWRIAQVWLLFGAVLVACVLLALAWGAGSQGPVQMWKLLAAGDPVARAIVLDVRLPRAVGAAIVGAALSLAGVLLQAATRNPVADPYLIGTSAGATTTAVLAAPLAAWVGGWAGVRWEELLPWLQPVAAFVGALAAVTLAFAIARAGGPLRPDRVLLAGLVLTAFGGAATSFFLYQFSDIRLRAASQWLMGGVTVADVRLSLTLGSVVLGVLLWSLAHAPGLNALGLGDDAARGIGVDEARLSRHAVWLSSALAAVAVSLAGIIGFVGLLVPHALRGFLGRDHRLLLPGAALGGAAFLVLCDLLARLLLAPAELPVGILTAFAGAPVLVVLLGLHKRIPNVPRAATRPANTALAPTLLTADHLHLHHPGAPSPALVDVSLRLEPGRLVVIVGANGAGKSTLLRVLAGVTHPSSGHMLDHGQPRVARDHAPPHIAFLPQSPRAEPGLTVRALVALGRTQMLADRPWRTDLPDADLAAVTHAVTQCGLADSLDAPCSDLSGGQLQRAFVAMVLCRQTPVLLLDEPTASLDLPQADQLLALLEVFAHSEQRLVIVAMHDLRLALRRADAVLVMQDGRLTGPFAPDDAALGPALQAAMGEAILDLAGLPSVPCAPP